MANEIDPRPNHTKLETLIKEYDLDPNEVLDDLLSYLSDNEIKDFIESSIYEDLLEEIESIEEE